MTYFDREICPLLLEALSSFPVVVLTGMRQVGKSTLLQQSSRFPGRRYLSLDDFAVLEAAKSSPEALIKGSDTITVDEAQKCPQLLTAIKREVDRDRTPGRFLLSGSASFGLLEGVSESLAGRALFISLEPFTRRELEGRTAEEPFLVRFAKTLELPRGKAENPLLPEEILRGGMPPACLFAGQPYLWFKGYEQTYLERDIRELSQVADIISFRSVLHLAALRTAQVLKTSELGRDAKLSSVTAGRYLSLLEASFVLRRIPPFLRNRASRLIKSPKVYLADSGIAAYLSGVGSLEIGEDEPLRGALFETYVAQNLAGILGARWPQARLSFWHVQGRHEVDFIIESGRESIAIEVKSAARWDDRDLRGLRTFLETTPRAKAAVLAHNGTEAVELGGRLWAIPLGLVLA
jgi:hypothetical protein